MKEKILLQIKKILLKTLNDLPDNKLLPYKNFLNDINLYFINTLGIKDFQKVKEYVNEVLRVLKEKEYVNIINNGFREEPNSIITKGLDFDEWITKMENKNESNINISNLNATNIQVGNNNIQNIDYTAEDFVKSLVGFEEKSSKEKKSIISQLTEFTKEGVNLAEIISKFASLLG